MARSTWSSTDRACFGTQIWSLNFQPAMRLCCLMVRGMCLYNQDKLTDARGSFVSCRNESRLDDDEPNQRSCASWITFIDRERDRQAKLAAAG